MMSEDQLDDLKITYKVLKKIMKNNNMTKDTSFVRVLNYVSNLICEEIV
jgi:hypothetical protein